MKSEENKDKTQIIQMKDKMIIVRGGVILAEFDEVEEHKEWNDKLDPLAISLEVMRQDQERIEKLADWQPSYWDEMEALCDAEELETLKELARKHLTKIFMDEMESEKKEKPSIICVKEKTDRSSFMSAVGTGGVFEYYANEVRVNDLNQYEIVRDGNKIALHLVENVERIWDKNSRVEIEEDDFCDE